DAPPAGAGRVLGVRCADLAVPRPLLAAVRRHGTRRYRRAHLGLHADHGRLTVRRNFLLLLWPPKAPDAEALAARLQAAAAEAPTWRLAIARPGLALWLAGREDLPVRVLESGGG